MAKGGGKRKNNKTGANSKAPTTALVKAVAKKVLSDQLEDKYARLIPPTESGVPVYFNANISANSECYPVLPQVAQGTNSNERIGDKIRPKRLRVDFVITANGSYNSSQLNQVRLFVLQDKSIKDLEALRDSIVEQRTGTPISTELLDVGGQTNGFFGNPDQVMSRVNRNRYQVYKDKVCEVIAGLGQTPQATNLYLGTQVFVSDKQCWKFSVIIPTPVLLHYSQNDSVWPTNFAPFFCLGYVQPDGNAAPDSILQRIAVNWYCHLDYEDA
jgi:hypothetical protein